MNPAARGLDRLALDVRCPVHQVPEGTRCPVKPGGSFTDTCRDRRALAETARWLAEFPEAALDASTWGQLQVMLLKARDLLGSQQAVLFRQLPCWNRPGIRPAPAAAADDFKERKLMTPAQVATLLNVSPKTVTRWARAGILPSVRTPGGHRRYDENDISPYVNGTVGLPDEAGEPE